MKKKILSLALVCLMIMTAFATMVSAETTAPFTVTGNDAGETAVDCTTWKDALTQVYAYGGGVISINEDYSLTSSDVYDNNDSAANVVVNITINGNGKTLSGAKTPFIFNFGDKVVVNNVNVSLGSVRFAEIFRGTHLKFVGCTFTTSGSMNDSQGFFRTPNVAGTEANTLEFVDSTITQTGTGGNIIGVRQSAHILDVIMDNVTVNATGASGGYRSFAYGIRNVTLNDTKIYVNQRVFHSIKNGTIKITGESVLVSTNTNTGLERAIIDVASDYNVYIGENAKLSGMALYTSTTANKINIYSANPEFYYTSFEKSGNNITVKDLDTTYAAPTLEDGASVRTTKDDDGEGLRFTANIAKDTTAKEYGIIAAATTNELTGDNFNMNSLADGTYVKAASTDANFKKNDSGKNIVYNAVLTKIPDAKLNTQYSARAYATYTAANANVTVTVYSAYNATDNARSIAFVANSALDDLKTQAQVDADPAIKDQYFCKVTVSGEVMYSCYDINQRAVLLNIVERGNAN